MVRAAAELADDFAFRSIRHRRIVTWAHQVAFRAIEDIAYVGAEQFLSRQPTDFENQLAVAIIEDAYLRIGCLAVIDITESASDALNRLRQFVFVEPPTGHVHLMNALIA